MRKICVTLPAYNEAKCLPQLLDKIGQTIQEDGFNFEIIVVDDGSKDDTVAIAHQAARQWPVHLVRHQCNQGLHVAINSCLRTAVQRCKAGDIVITMDADDTHPPDVIKRLLCSIDGGNDIAIASRYRSGARVSGVPWHRVILAHAASCLFRCVMPIRGVRDFTSGYRAYRFEAIETAIDFYGDDFVSQQGFSCTVDILLKMRRFNFAIGEVPIDLEYDRKQTPSKMAVGSTVWTTLLLLAKRRLGGY